MELCWSGDAICACAATVPAPSPANRVLAKSKVGSSRKEARVGFTSSFLKLQSSGKKITKTRQTIKNSEKKDEYELDKHEVSKPLFFLSFYLVFISRQVYLDFQSHRIKF